MDPEVSKAKFDRELAVLLGDAHAFVEARRWQIAPVQFPEFLVVFVHGRSTRSIGFRFLFDDWDEQPPSLSLFDPQTKSELPWDKWPQGGWSTGNTHPVTKKPFLCLPGIREYHTHSSHIQDFWHNYRAKGSYTLGSIVDRVWQRFEDTNG